MSLWSKISALFRGAAHEGGQQLVDANALRILDQEIRDADTAQGKARDDLAGLVARRRTLENDAKQLRDQIGKYEASARAAMAKGDEALALEVAQRIADLDRDGGQKASQAQELRAAEDRLRTTISATDTKIENLRREIEIVKVNESVQRAQSAVVASSSASGTHLGSAADSLKRIRERQSVRDEKFKAHAEIEERRTGADLDNKLRDAGILPGQTNAADVLARLMQPKEETVTEAAPLQIRQAEPVSVKRGES